MGGLACWIIPGCAFCWPTTPPRPKEAMEAALRQVRKPRSSAIYLELAQRVSLRGHTEPAFQRFVHPLFNRFLTRDNLRSFRDQVLTLI